MNGHQLGAVADFLAGLAQLSERTGVGIHARGSTLEIDGAHFPFSSTHRDNGDFDYVLGFPPADPTP